MNTPPEVRQAAPRRFTSAALTIGVLVAASCFGVAVAADRTEWQAKLTLVGDALTGRLSLNQSQVRIALMTKADVSRQIPTTIKPRSLAMS